VASGIVGNVIDRVFRGEVVDFLQFYFLQLRYSWPSFNVADSCITVGVIIFIVSSIFRPESVDKEARENEAGLKRD
jgi:signal peptidase II